MSLTNPAVGVIGFGRFGQLHARFIDRLEGASLAAIAVRSEASAEAARNAHPEAQIHRDWRALIADPAIDVVDIVAPNALHAEMALTALEAGKHVMLEKPMATKIADCDRIVEAARQSNRQLSVGFELRLSVQWGRIKRLIDEGAVGRPRYLNIALFRHPYRRGADGWRLDANRVGSWILEEPVHFYDFAMWYLAGLGDPLAVSAQGTSASGAVGMYENFSSHLRFDGAYAAITQTLAGFGHHMVVEMAGDDGALRATWSGAEAASDRPSFDLWVKRAGSDEAAPVALEGASGELFELEEEIRLTLEAFRQGWTLVGPEEARKSVVVCLEAERALREGREVALAFER